MSSATLRFFNQHLMLQSCPWFEEGHHSLSEVIKSSNKTLDTFFHTLSTMTWYMRLQCYDFLLAQEQQVHILWSILVSFCSFHWIGQRLNTNDQILNPLLLLYSTNILGFFDKNTWLFCHFLYILISSFWED